MSLPLSIDRQLARQPDDGARAVYLHHKITETRFDHALEIEALQHRLRFVEGRVRESIKRAERKL
jgi:hypothetical protein